MMKKNISVFLDGTLYDKAKDYGKSHGQMSLASVVRLALVNFFNLADK